MIRAVTPQLVSLLKRPGAFLPIAMSLAALAVVAARVAIVGTTRETDEGTAAHVWQLLTAGQIPVIAFFAITALRQTARDALLVLALQFLAALAAAAPVFLLRW
ncbi:MAG: hypothetical protein M3067_05790 [Chloroflexota bacterium]|nr:hypothetical protein [Chloroflexota bacterium]